MCAGCHGTVLPFYASALSCESRFTPSAETFFSNSSFVFFIRSLIIQSTDVVTSRVECNSGSLFAFSQIPPCFYRVFNYCNCSFAPRVTKENRR